MNEGEGLGSRKIGKVQAEDALRPGRWAVKEAVRNSQPVAPGKRDFIEFGKGWAYATLKNVKVARTLRGTKRPVAPTLNPRVGGWGSLGI